MTEQIHVLTEIKDANHISYSELAEKLGVSRQYLCNIYTGNRKMSSAFTDKVKALYPEFFNKQEKFSTYRIPFCPEQLIPHKFDLYSSNFPSVVIDKRLIPRGVTLNEIHCRIVTLSDYSLSPFYLKGDKIILDTSQKRLIDGLSYLISCNGINYIRKIKLLPNKIRCVSTFDDRDTFYEEEDNITVLGQIIPNVRF